MTDPTILPETSNDRPSLPWDLYTVFATLVAGYMLIPALLDSVLHLMLPGLDATEHFLVDEALPLASWLIIFAVMASACRRVQLRWRPILGLSFEKHWEYYVRQCLWAVIIIGALIFILNTLLPVTGVKVPQHLYDHLNHAQLRVLGVVAVALAPVLEEIVFRGYLQSALMRVLSPWWSVVVTALVFLLFHVNYLSAPVAVGYVLALGLMLSFFRLRTGSVLPGIAGHLANNILATMELWHWHFFK